MIPEFEYFILPTLTALSAGNLLSLDDIRSAVISHFGFSDEELKETTKSGHNTKVNDRTTWALTYLRQAGLAESPKRAFDQITFAGLELLENPPSIITRDFLFKNYPLFRDFQNRSRGKKDKTQNSQRESVDSIPKKNTVVAKYLPHAQDLFALRTAIESFRKLGIEPTEEQLKKLSELESKILTEIIAKDLTSSLSGNFSEISDEFVVKIKYSNHHIFIHVDTSEDAITSFPNADSVEIIPTSSKVAIAKTKRKRRPNLNFFEMGLITGDVLNYVEDPDITVTIARENKVLYNGTEYSLTKLTQELKGLPHAIQPTGEWLFEGRNLIDLYNDTYQN